MQSAINAQPLTARVRLVIGALIVIATALFVAGIVIERGVGTDHHDVSSTKSIVPAIATPQQTVTGMSSESGEAGESGATHSAEQGQTAPVPHQETGETGAAETASSESKSETVLGINLENPWIVSAFVIGWLVLLLGLFLLGRLGLILVLLASLVSAFFDIAEVIHQIGRSNASVATIAILVATTHIAILLLAVMALMRRAPSATIPSSLPNLTP